jgi:hypothetical protein
LGDGDDVMKCTILTEKKPNKMQQCIKILLFYFPLSRDAIPGILKALGYLRAL